MTSPILTSSGANVALELVRGSAFARTITYKTNGSAQNLTGYTFAGQVRTASGTLAATFTIAIVNAAAGTFSVALSSAQTSALDATLEYNWSIEQTVSAITTELIRGSVVVLDEVTQ